MSIPPVIIIGMHRSGTSLLSRILDKMGIFMGSSLNIHHEAKYFLDINIWILSRLNSKWDNPPDNLDIDIKINQEILNLIDHKLHSISRIKYLGVRNYLKYKDIRDIDFYWGWKDPRNTFTIDFWLDFFPKAKIIHVYRNPIDVALSLKKREEAFIAALKNRNFIKKVTFFYRKEYIAKELLNIENGIKLWERYISRIKRFEDYYNGKILHIKYEELLLNPYKILTEIASFINIKKSKENLEKIVATIDNARSYNFLKNNELKQCYYKIKDNPLLKELGYDNLV